MSHSVVWDGGSDDEGDPDMTQDGVYLILGRGPVQTTVHDARRVPDLSLERNGFELFRGEYSGLALEEFYCSEQVASRYYAELSATMKRHLGCSEAVCYMHVVRNKDRAEDYVARVHTDHSMDQGLQIVRDVLGEGRAAEAAAGTVRFQIVNAWRSIGAEPVQRDPLALLDTSSVEPGDVSSIRLMIKPEASASARWFYYPRMTPDELLVFKQYDSSGDLSHLCFHTSFDPRHVPDGAPTRESIEARLVLVFDEAGTKVENCGPSCQAGN